MNATYDSGELEVGLDQFDLSRNDGVLTLVSPKTGDHRTFKVSTIRRGNLTGKRTVALLAGSNNEEDYTPFGFVVNGQFEGAAVATVVVWQRFRSGDPATPTLYQKYADLLNRPAYWASRGFDYKMSLHCRRCGRLLTHPESITSGYGPECVKKVQE